jgi:lysophospholipase L1-like esterase
MTMTLRVLGLLALTAGFTTLATPMQAQDKATKKDADKKTDKKPAGPSYADRPEKREHARLAEILEVSRKGDVDVLFMGDSITQGWNKAGAAAWKEHFEPLKAGNFGIGGDRTQHVLWRITEGKELDTINPKVCVLMIGTNNSGTNTAIEIARGVEAIVQEFRKQKPQMKILILGVFPRGPRDVKDFAPAATLNTKLPVVNKMIETLADGKMIFYKDIGKQFLNDKGDLPMDVMPDLLHLSPKGYEIWAKAIKEDVVNLLK